MKLSNSIADQTLLQKKSEIGESVERRKNTIKKPKGRRKLANPSHSRGRKGSRIPNPSSPGIGSKLMNRAIICSRARSPSAERNSPGACKKKL